MAQAGIFRQVSEVSWEIPVTYKAGMRVPAKIYATRKLLDGMDSGVIEQVTNVASLPGIVKSAYAMADAHWGYGFPIGGVAAFDVEKGVISPGGIGFDINCGMRLIRTNLRYAEVKPKIKELVDLIFRLVPAGVGVKGFLRVTDSQFDEIMKYGVKWCAENGQAWEDDPSHVEEGGYIKGADPTKVSRQARSRGIEQLGKNADTTIIIENDRILSYAPNLQMEKAFELIDSIAANAIKGISDT
ncbi:MAG: RtcB family protein, partial [Nitrososphaerota archaeon]|nr:RtcB family protein [Nitrososphaerota archaeon]